ncbi:putative sulfite exporter family protein [Rosellinia necatrix]|uniref:Putative sulfite exporter family protein n=1 Tax=Rosellinia necatrix TaxID=77044 RepID=A0A1W2TN60_ROSNE|nr:putative sulfite exporter family protein [Rosellinia necatrix]
MTTRWGYLWALLFLFLHLQAVVASPLQLFPRQDTALTATRAPTATATATATGKEDTISPTVTDKPDGTNRPTATVSTSSATSFPSAINGNRPNNSSSITDLDPIPEGQLPLQPRLTPGWGVAGALLLITGATYTLVGIKNAWLHTFFSTAFLSGLSVTVLIVYVMTPPVSAAIEGAYVVAAVVAGLILGGAATVFREITEGLGCLLGGFCISMWLLALQPGGLLPAAPAKIIFIASFSVGSYGFYFSHYTRPYALMGLMSFAGATVTVVGIDCFSRAGLKEFWAYIWNLNKGLFPYEANTYPLTKGIRVEIALTVVFAIIGIISQLKLWKVIQERRAKKLAQQTEAQRQRDEEEANLGLQIEAQTARERQQWETVYGDAPPRSPTKSDDSGVEDLDDEKKGGISPTAVGNASSDSDGDNIEMTDLPTSQSARSVDPAGEAADGIMTTDQDDENKVTIKVARDTEHQDVSSTADPDEKVWAANGDGEERPSSPTSLQGASKPPGPSVTPLPFRIPSGLDENDSRSSIATYADEDDGDYVLSNKSSRLSLTNRLSASSGNLLKSLSQRTARSQVPQQKAGEFGMQQHLGWTESTEGLVEDPKRHSDALSLAVTMDRSSYDGDDDPKPNAESVSIPAVTVDLGGETAEAKPTAPTAPTVDQTSESEMTLKPPNSGRRANDGPTSSAETIGTEILNPSAMNLSSGDTSKRNSSNQSTRKTGSTNDNSAPPTDMNAVEGTSESSRPPKSATPSMASISVSLTKDRLPSALPRVALSYRTNEWAKHLSTAEAPPLEQLQLNDYPELQKDGTQRTETVAPVHVEDLQQTVSSTVAPTAAVGQAASLPYRSTSRLSSHTSQPKAHVQASLAILTGTGPEEGAQEGSAKPTAPILPQAGHSFKNKRQRGSSELYSRPVQEERGSHPLPAEQSTPVDGEGASTPNSLSPSPIPFASVPGVVSYSSPQTLLGKREMFLRNRSQSQLLSTPIQEGPEQVTRSVSRISYNATPPPPPSVTAQDADNIPLSQRKQLIRQNSVQSGYSMNSTGGRPQQGAPMNTSQPQSFVPYAAPRINTITAESSNFDSHQPHRGGPRTSQAERDARLSQFRQSVAAELRSPPPAVQKVRETPLLQSNSSTSLLGPSNSNAEITRALDQSRNAMMSQRDQDAQKREMDRWEKERHERAFEELMRRGDLLDAHREALRRMQGGVKHE